MHGSHTAEAARSFGQGRLHHLDSLENGNRVARASCETGPCAVPGASSLASRPATAVSTAPFRQSTAPESTAPLVDGARASKPRRRVLRCRRLTLGQLTGVEKAPVKRQQSHLVA
mmetsp:Transcript_920/g.2959  ORF Transcript_920/g.2959 Transcript_920/m.2959 type:complete len:115 (-) Transcript_920:76-420(-)